MGGTLGEDGMALEGPFTGDGIASGKGEAIRELTSYRTSLGGGGGVGVGRGGLI